MTESGQPMGNLEKFIPDKGKGQVRLKHPFWVGLFFFFFSPEARKEKHGYRGRRRKEGD